MPAPVLTSAAISPVERLRELGGIATRKTLLRSCDRAALDRATAVGDVVRIARGRYALGEVDEGKVAAARVGGVLCLTSAALVHGWAVKTVPDRPHVMVSRGRRVDRSDRSCQLHFGELDDDQVDGGVTTVETTLAHCLRRLRFDEALAIADSAMRSGVPRSTLRRLAEGASGPGSAQMRRVAELASPEAANPFESVLRSIAVDVPGLNARPQVKIREPGMPGTHWSLSSPTGRVSPVKDPKETLVEYLQSARDAMVWKVEGLSDYDARRPMTPTGTNLLGLVKHLASVELGYFGDTFGRPSGIELPWHSDDADMNDDLYLTADESREWVLDLYRTAWAHAAVTFEECELDTVGRVPWWGDRGEVTLHQILVHMATETHRHAGHADIVRETIDGQVGRKPDDGNIEDGYDWPAYVARVEAAARAAQQG